MIRLLSYFILTALVTTTTFGQQKKEVLLTIDDTPVYASEFKRVYKKNLELVQDERQKTVDGYLDLFVDYKLKVKEAQAQDLDKSKQYLREFEKYQEQLSRYYIYEDNATEELVREAYERAKEEIKARHLLILSSFSDSPEDTLKAYNKIEKLRQRALAGDDFTQLVKKNSEEPKANETGGLLNYFSVFGLVYPFESEAYNTPVGEISEIVRTRFGYHIIKVLDRREREPKRTVSHIMISDRDDDTRTFDPKERIDEIYQLLQQGEKFEDLAKQYSEDKGSAQKGGKLRPVGKGEISATKFDEVIFNIAKEGDITAPFKSSFGWHIARLDVIIENASFEEEKEMLTARVKNGNRSKVVTSVVTNQIKDKYGFTSGTPFLPYFENHVDSLMKQGRWKYEPIPEKDNKVLFTIGDRNIYFAEFASYIRNNQRAGKNFKSIAAALHSLYVPFETEMVKQYYKDKLEDEDEEYAGVISEYRDGLLIFDLMQKNIWDKAKKDTLGAKAFYDSHKDEFMWKQRVDAIVVHSKESSYAKKAKKLLKAGKTAEEIKAAFNTNDTIHVIVSSGIFEEGDTALPKDFEMKKGIFETPSQENRYTVVKVLSVLPSSVKEFDEVRGRVMTKFQQQLEDELMISLREKYKVTLNKKTLKKIKKELEK